MELIRLTDDKLIDELTFDKSDSFYWLKQQAKRGVASAQVICLMYPRQKNIQFVCLATSGCVNVCWSEWFNT
jgi:hypothetical protein